MHAKPANANLTATFDMAALRRRLDDPIFRAGFTHNPRLAATFIGTTDFAQLLSLYAYGYALAARYYLYTAYRQNNAKGAKNDAQA